ncbi:MULTISPECIES: LacI family DNA-binding transcriptional regulator [Gracilimonas]|uniref:LacI family transcriptional regulator n=1 Tax=Gracilimonas sediminicola TaxID=2952158 RepID=A0A9X2RFE5_9BACT|nr:LacI family DNA-binding transcriptional regulator [Gracilimonas sediminicola]MCP9292646.1 LacI family transcriptional regulator [Gracilimonas sediminicola]
MNKKVTIYEVAKRAEVAISTVSRVLNGSENVSKVTKEKVEKAIDDLNFRPQVNARKLASKEPQMLAIAVPSFTTPYFNEVLKGVKDEIKKMDLDIIMYNTGSKDPEEAVQNFFDRGTADAVILLSIDVSDKVHKLIQATRTPAVLVNASHPSYDYFMLNDYKGGYLAGEHLVKQGFEELGMITSVVESRASLQRIQGFKDALKNYKMKIDQSLFKSGDSTKHGGFTEESGFEAIYKFDKQGKFPDAIFCSNDTQAVGAIYALSKLGMKVPDDVAIMGYDNIKLSKYLELTTIDQKMYTIGVQATKRLAEIIKKPGDELYQTTINPVLVKRGSTENKKAK